MDLKSLGGSNFGLNLNEVELNILFSCLRESFATIGRNSYPTRIGVPLEVASALGDELMNLMGREGLEQ